MRRSLYLKDDDYRLSFLYGNFTTLTRFTESDLERVITEGLSPLYVSIHATDPEVRADMLRNRRGRHQPAVAAGPARPRRRPSTARSWSARASTTARCSTTRWPACSTSTPSWPPSPSCPSASATTPTSPACGSTPPPRPPTSSTASRTGRTCSPPTLGRRLVYAADEYYLLADRPFPPAEVYGDFAMHEDGIGMARTFEAEFTGAVDAPTGPEGRLLLLGRRRPRRGLPGRRATARRPGRQRPAPATTRRARSASSPRRTAPGSSARCSTDSAATTSACAWSRTASSAATSRSPA